MLSIGLMSGTSMDGIDAALIDTDGSIDIHELGAESLAYDSDFKILLKSAELAVRTMSGDLDAAKRYYSQAIQDYLRQELKMLEISIPEKLKSLAFYLHGDEEQPITFDQVVSHSTQLHAKVVRKLLERTKHHAQQIDVIGYHGQTLFHQPSSKITIQVGDGTLLSDLTGMTVVNDFRSKDVAAGGQGAPLAPLYHQALAVRDKLYPAAIVNCGGIANITIVTGEKDNEVIGFDTGPGNGLIDRYIKQRTQGKEYMDEDGKYGAKGKVSNDILQQLYEKAIQIDGKNFFEMASPKSLDIGDLTLLTSLLDTLSLEDACATLEAFTADTIVRSIEFITIDPPQHWILAGGGWNNPVILQELTSRLKAKLGSQVTIMTADERGWNSTAMEAQTFAYLAVRSLQGKPISVPSTTRVPMPLSGGCIHVPPSSIDLAKDRLGLVL